MGILVLVVVLTIFISANCSLYESVLFSTRVATLEAIKRNKTKEGLAIQMLHMKKNIESPIAAILVMNTIANTAGATIAGMYAADIFIPSMVIIFSVIFTLAILFFSEIIPKTLGAIHWRSLWYITVYPVTFLQYTLTPIIFFTRNISKLLTKKKKESTFTEEEILAMVHVGAKEGEISHQESMLVRNIINLEEKQVRTIMTPRTVMYSLESGTSITEALKLVEGREYTRFPVYETDKENITGYVLLRDLYFEKGKKNARKDLSSVIRPISSVAESANCLTLLTDFLKNRKQLTVVMDEYGGVAGLVTLEDIIETVLGTEIVDETDIEPDLQKAAKKQKQGQQRRKKDSL